MEKPIKVFLSYAGEGIDAVKSLYDRLQAEGFRPWMAEKALLPGASWEMAFNV